MTPSVTISTPASAPFDLSDPRSHMPDLQSFLDLFPTHSNLVDLDAADMFVPEDQRNIAPAFSVEPRPAPLLGLSPSPSSTSENNIPAQPQPESCSDRSRISASLPSESQPEQFGSMLHCIHRELHDLRAKIDNPRCTPSKTISHPFRHFFGAFAKLVERLHAFLRPFFASTALPSPDGAAAPCDFSTGISLISTMATTLEIYGVVMNHAMMSLPSSTTLNGAKSGETTSPDTITSDTPRPAFPSNLDPEAIQIGCFTPSIGLACWIRMNVLLYEIRTSQKLVDEMRRYFLRLRPTAHASFINTAMNNTPANNNNSNNNFSNADANGTATGKDGTTARASLSYRRSSISVLTAESCFTLLRLCEDLLSRFNEIERIVDQDVRRHPSCLD